MKRYIYGNATVYITEPTDEHLRVIRKSTESFLKKVIKEKNKNESGTNHRRITRNHSNSRR